MAIGNRTQGYETHYDIQAGELHQLIAPRCEIFTTAIKNAASRTHITGGIYSNATFGSDGTIVNNLAAASNLIFAPGFVTSVTSVLTDAGSNTSYIYNGQYALPSGGNITFGGDTNLYRTSAGTLATDGNIKVASSVLLGADCQIYRDSSNRLRTDNELQVHNGRLILTSTNLEVFTAGRGLRVAEGANAKQGVSTLVAGTVTVANTSVTANSRIFLTVQSLGTVTAPKALAVTARSAGVSFTITSEDNTDTSVVAWEICEPAA